jgi:hypothetical protein
VLACRNTVFGIDNFSAEWNKLILFACERKWYVLEQELDNKSDPSSISLVEEHNKNLIHNITNLKWTYMHLHIGVRKFQWCKMGLRTSKVSLKRFWTKQNLFMTFRLPGWILNSLTPILLDKITHQANWKRKLESNFDEIHYENSNMYLDTDLHRFHRSSWSKSIVSEDNTMRNTVRCVMMLWWCQPVAQATWCLTTDCKNGVSSLT